ncbi:DUF86 domain-containing protein [Beijerinckia sp. L45]|uniref:HepT-like ribonuclease domain-containing protein n=1 Tax=Beijerinckia sp. L45 TaxID=1641855 RepID=UPI00131DCDFE|nr:DUF86 domain-containing protein [Beijerinckia sp. L45]
MWRDDALLLDIVMAASDARAFVRNLDFEAFLNSRLHQNAVIRSLEVIGEAAGKLTAEFKDIHPSLPWRDMINMRHRLIHAYGDVSLDVVWDIIQNDLPSLIATLKPLIPPDI